QHGTNPFASQLAQRKVSKPLPNGPSGQQDKPVAAPMPPAGTQSSPPNDTSVRESGALEFLSDNAAPQDSALTHDFYSGTTSIEAADAEGWGVSVTPSGGWVPAVIAGRTGIGLSQRAQSFVTDSADGPFNVIEPGKKPRVTLTPTLALKDGKPFLAFSVQGGDTQDQNLLQFFLNVVDFGMTVQEATEAANITSYQMRDSFNDHQSFPGRLTLNSATPPYVRQELTRMGYQLEFEERSSGPINAIMVDRKHGTLWGGSSNHGEDY